MGIRKRSGELGRVKRGVTKTLGCRGFLDEMTSEEDGVGGRKRNGLAHGRGFRKNWK